MVHSRGWRPTLRFSMMILHSEIDRATPHSMHATHSDVLGPLCASQPRKLRRAGDEDVAHLLQAR
jgi:hypothetical protein